MCCGVTLNVKAGGGSRRQEGGRNTAAPPSEGLVPSPPEDSLSDEASDEEIVAVLAHELGHWHHGHVLLTFAISQLYVFAAFYFFAGCMGSVDIYNAFGFRAVAGASDTAGAPVIVGVLLFFAFLTPANTAAVAITIVPRSTAT